MATTVYTGSPITITGVNGKYNLGYYFECGAYSESGTIASNVSSSTYTWTPATSKFLPGFGDSTKGTLQITVYPKNTQLSATIHYNYILVLDENVKPIIDSVSIARSGTTYNSKSLSERTNVGLSISVQKVSGAKQTVYISSPAITYVSYVDAGSGTTTLNQVFSPVKVASGDYVDVTYIIKAVDSRGRSDTKTITERVYKYTPPKPTVKESRSEDGTNAVLTFSESHMSTVAGLANNITKFQATLYYSITDNTSVVTNLLNAVSPCTLSGALEPDKSYTIRIEIQDQVGGTTILDLVSAGDSPVMDFGEDGNTIAFFGSAPVSADKQSVIIGNEKSSQFIFDEDIMKYSRNGRCYFKMGMDATNDIETLSFGYNNEVSGDNALVFGMNNQVTGRASMAMGEVNTVSGVNAFAFGNNLLASGAHQTVVGKYNVEDTEDKYLFVVGNGTNIAFRSNAFGVLSDGDIEINGKSVNNQFAGEIGRWYCQGDQTLTADKSAWKLSPFTNGASTTFGSSFVTVTNSNTLKVIKPGLYIFIVRASFKPYSAGGRAQFDIYINDARISMYSCTLWSPKVDTRIRIIPYIMQLNANDRINFYAKMIDADVGYVNPVDTMAYVLDYPNKYK